MLYLIGLGLWDELDISVRGLEIARKCEKVYLEGYTSRLMGLNLDNLERMIGKKVQILEREDVELKPGFLKIAKDRNVAILVGGDPLVATTHHDLILRAREMGIKTRIIHNASIVSAIAETGLQIYKFGQTVTIPFWAENFKPKSFYEKILQNLDLGLHTLVLLDIDSKNSRFMTANEGLRRIWELDGGRRIQKVVVIARLGGPDPLIRYGKIGDLLNQDFGPPLHCIVIPGKLHTLEKEYLETL